MAQITTVALAAFAVKQYVGSITLVRNQFSPTALAAAVTNGDRILIATLPASAKIVGCGIFISSASGITGIIDLSVVEPTSNRIFLSSTTLAPSVALGAVMTQPHERITSVTGTRDFEIEVASGSFSNTTASQVVVVDCIYGFNP